MKIREGIGLDFDDVLIVPQRSTISSRKNVNLERTFKFLYSSRTWTGIPIMCANMSSVASIKMAKALAKHKIVTCLHKYYKPEELIELFKDESIRDYIWVSIGFSDKDLENLKQIASALNYQPNICIDVPNGHMDCFVGFCLKVRSYMYDSIIVAGNVATRDMTQQLLLHGGVDLAKINIGNGKACKTRIVTGVGYPTLTCIDECSHVAHGLNNGVKRLGLICSDGGCKNPGDIAKAFVAGADFVMIGSMFSGTDECDQEEIMLNGKKHFRFYGMSSHLAQEIHAEGKKKYRASEGEEFVIPAKGSVDDVVQEILGGLRSSCAYIGAQNIKDMSKCGEFIRVTRIHQNS